MTTGRVEVIFDSTTDVVSVYLLGSRAHAVRPATHDHQIAAAEEGAGVKKYQVWIDHYVSESKVLNGACGSATLKMAAQFPELKRVPGHVRLVSGGSPEHWWCETPDGQILDPTVGQWAEAPIEYVPWRPGDLVRMGRCMNCGESIYGRPESLDGHRKTCCSDECEEEMIRDLG